MRLTLSKMLSTVTVGTCAAVLWPALPAVARSSPEWQMPFACGERWEGSTRPDHSPSTKSIDWNRDAYDLGHIVSASAPGVVTEVTNLGDSSYGLHIVVDHGGGWTSLHAHLLRVFVVPGERIDQGQAVALLGDSGNSSGAHLHYEQRLDKTNQHAVFDGSSFVYDSWLTSLNCGDVPVVGDWNGDRLSDVGVFGRHAVKAQFRKRLPSGNKSVTSVGLPTDTPLVGDWNGDGQSEVGVWSQPTATFTLQKANGGQQVVPFGDRKDRPVSGDWNGDGRWDVGTFDPRTTTFALRDSRGNVTTQVFGIRAGLPIAGDWDGDGRSNVGVYNPATTTFRLSLPGGVTKEVDFGTRTSLPVVGSWNTDAISDLGVWDTKTAVFSKRFTAKRTETTRFGHIR